MSWRFQIYIAGEFEDIIKHTTLNREIPFNFNSEFISLHFGKDKQRKITYSEFTQLIHVRFTFCFEDYWLNLNNMVMVKYVINDIWKQHCFIQIRSVKLGHFIFLLIFIILW